VQFLDVFDESIKTGSIDLDRPDREKERAAYCLQLVCMHLTDQRSRTVYHYTHRSL